MQEEAIRKMFLGFIQIHILHHAAKEPIYGSWMIEELNHHGYSIGPGTLYPILHTMEKNGLLTRDNRNVDGKVRKYYTLTEVGRHVLKEGKMKAQELLSELEE